MEKAKLLKGWRTQTFFEQDKEEESLQNLYMGLIGQYMFETMLTQCRIPYLVDQVASMEEHRTYCDFIIKDFGIVEIKTRPKNTDCLIVKQSEWKGMIEHGTVPDYVIALKLLSGMHIAEIMGWIPGEDVEDLPNNPDICIYTPCHWIPYSKLNDFEELVPRLQKASLEPERFLKAFEKH